MACTTLESMNGREVVRCGWCSVTQFKTQNGLCRACHKPFDTLPALVPTPNNRPPDRPAMPACGTLITRLPGVITDIRRSRGLSQYKLAKRIGMKCCHYVSRIEHGDVTPTVMVLERVGVALLVNTSQIIQLAEEPGIKVDGMFRAVEPNIGARIPHVLDVVIQETGMKVFDLAWKMGVAPSCLYNTLHGKKSVPRLPSLQVWAGACSTTVHAIIRRAEEGV
ncbi:MAG TPA: helix-turn-helix transcriptional regulator [Candidatus Paceibacterota bacterium]|nr:helix-turn-helix transcriptional regulator [Candidatus Paceibacterota bacterium]